MKEKLLKKRQGIIKGTVVNTGWLTSKRLSQTVTLLNGQVVRWLNMCSKNCPGISFRMKVIIPPLASFPLDLLMLGNRFQIDGAIVYNCAGGDYMTLKINDGDVKLKSNNVAYDNDVLGLRDMDVSDSESDEERDSGDIESSEDSSSE